MRMTVSLCDLCLSGDGEKRLATARYWNKEGEEWDACEDHLRDVQRASLDWEEYDEPGGP